MKRSIIVLSCMIAFLGTAQQTNFLTLCENTYSSYPSVPRGVLEAISFTQTRMSYLDDSELASCVGLPKSYGYLGMIQDGKGYFKSTMRSVSLQSGISISTIKSNPAKELEAVARVVSQEMQLHIGATIEQKFVAIFERLSYLPDTGKVNQFARNSEMYELFRFLNNEEYAEMYHFPKYRFDLNAIFGANLAVLSSTKIAFTEQGIVGNTGAVFFPKQSQLKSTEYGPAIFNPAASCNYGSRNGTAISAITIHTIQGSYAGAISWAQNCSSSVSYHYVVRSSDGQVTQMVNEANRAFHVGSANPYTIGYEHEGYVSQPQWYTMAMYNASAGITRDVCQSGYGINPLRTFFGAATSGTNTLGSCTTIKGHQHYANQTHTDPGINWNWELYYRLVNNNPTQTTQTGVTGTFTDTGGAGANYGNDERYFTLIQPAGASSITLNFSSFNLEANWDYMYIYDGSTNNAPLLGTFTGTTSPGTISSTSGSLLIEFRSDCATTVAGWQATWSATIPTSQPADATAPTTVVSAPTSWITQNFTTTFTDADNIGGSGLEKAFYQVLDYDGTEWRANSNKGFFSDNFDQTTIHPDWTSQVGTWGLASSYLTQSDESNGNTNIWTPVNHTLSNRYLYHWAGKMSGTGTNRRAGFHYFCSDPTLPNRGNSYFAFFRLDNDKVQIYEVSNDVFTLVNEVTFNFNADQWYDYKVVYDRITGKHQIYVDNSLVQTWVDPTPIATGNAVSFRSANCVYTVNDLKIYRSRFPSVTVGVGATEDLRYQSVNPSTAAGRIKSIVQDSVGNLSAIQSQDVKVDWTPPATVTSVNDGLGVDIATTTNNTMLEANWTMSVDSHSDVARNWYCIGTTPGGNDVLDWTDNYWNTTVSIGSLSLTLGTTYYVSVKVENGAGLFSPVTTSNGQTLVAPTAPPVANFIVPNTFVCAGTPINFQNQSIDGVSYEWTFTGATTPTSTATNPSVIYTATGSYPVQLIVTGPGGTDTTMQTIQVEVSQPISAGFTPNATTFILPNATATFTNNSQNANGYSWDFGDGGTSQDAQPFHNYTQAGVYTVLLTAVNNSCPQDTASLTIEVLDVAGLTENVGEPVSVYPNPATDEIRVEWTELNAVVFLYDVVGKLVFVGKLENGKKTISVGSFAQGAYRLVVTANGRFSDQSVLIGD